MRALKVSEEALNRGLLAVFREYGYEGATLARLRKATGLEKASLYHRFPGGKEEMAVRVVRDVGRYFEGVLLAPLRELGPLQERVRRTAAQVGDFYHGGRSACVLDTLSIAGGGEELREEIRRAYLAWRDAFAAAAEESGATASEAKHRAERAIVAIHGTLVLARATGDTRAFESTLSDLPRVLTGED